jgi:hypothetical protein
MNCNNHTDYPAVVVCVNCGAGLCAACAQKTDARKNVCSPECAVSVNALDSAITLIASRSLRASKATAWFCWLLGAIFAVVGGLSLLGGDTFFSSYLLASCVVFIFVGSWFARIGKKTSNTAFDVVPRPSVNTGHNPCAQCLRSRGAFLAPTALRLGIATMALRWVPTQLSGASRHRFALPGSAAGRRKSAPSLNLNVRTHGHRIAF